MIKVGCTWGDGPDVMVSFEGHGFVLYEAPDMKGWKHGLVENGSFDLTADEAEKLGQEILRAAQAARELDESYAEWCREHAQENPMSATSFSV